MNTKEAIIEIAQNPKTGHVVAGGTLTNGVGYVLGMIPDDIGKLGTLIGAVLSITLIYVHIGKFRADMRSRAISDEKSKIEMERVRLEVASLKEKLNAKKND